MLLPGSQLNLRIRKVADGSVQFWRRVAKSECDQEQVWRPAVVEGNTQCVSGDASSLT